ncbi:pyruvate dehydrogenase E2 component (dihydrolipoamide acetyltransferase) [Luteibacter rhizovicinus]|uniref:Acetyltransferase component of pyruvate dehydrogenase complex n=2 Tax=Luteibacter rhizovicinus TaxID=242606 RepID=A0A4R3YLM5_9GAMM|nr:pyruvate dehydrogenase E2 component (dihydrolipoamide acetyltransferase) [Luteibacter rhizovicinus]
MDNLKEVRVPDLGGAHDVPVIEWLVKVGDRVAVNQGIITLESDKATMEVPSSMAGIVRELKAHLGDILSEGNVIALIEVSDATVDIATSVADARPPHEADAAPLVRRVAIAATEPAEKPRIENSQASARWDASFVVPGDAPYASPTVRQLARELGVELAQVTGTGRNGRMLRGDVETYVRTALSVDSRRIETTASQALGGGLNLQPWPNIDFAKFGAIETQSLSRIQKVSGANLSRSWVVVPHVTQHDHADVTDLEAFRVQLNRETEKDGTKVTMLAFLIKASVVLLKRFPHVNASLDESGDTLILKKYYHVGFAADTPRGLVMPVLRDADKKGIREIARETASLATNARDSKLGPADMQGGCFSISSLGGIGGTAFTPIVNAPEVAILGVSKSSIQPVWDGTAFRPRLLLPLSLSYDHRVIDGAAAARFTAELAQLLGDFRRALL